MSESLTPLEAAEMLEDIAAVSDLKAVDGKRSGLVKIGRIDAEDLRIAASLLRAIAAGEYKRVVHAHWSEDTEPADGDIRCSNCGIAWPICVQKYLQHVGVKKWTNFLKICPDCGALMDEKDDSHG